MPGDPHTYRHRVRFRECDKMGVVYHVHYLDWFEVARTEALRDLGFPYKQIEESGYILPVTDLAAKFHQPARYDDEIIVETRVSISKSAVRITCEYVIRREKEDLKLVTGHVTLCFFDPKRSRPVSAPDEFLRLLRGDH